MESIESMALGKYKTGTLVRQCPWDDGDMVKRVVHLPPGFGMVSIEAAVCETCPVRIPDNGFEV